jgi:uncharacterized protein (TIGR02246 family)
MQKGTTPMTSTHARDKLVAEEGAVRAALEDVYNAWAANDADAFVASYSEDATAILPGSYLPSREAIRATMAALFAGALKGSRAIHDVQRVRFVDATTAIVINEGGVLLAGQSEPASDSRARETWVLSKHSGTWRIEAFHNAPLTHAD